jgi:hypothetical protein
MMAIGVIFIVLALIVLKDSQVIQNSLLIVGGALATVGGINIKKSKMK